MVLIIFFNMIDNSKEYILCAAIRRKSSREGEPYWKGTNDIMDIEIGYRHHDIFHRFNNRDIHQNYEDCEVSILMEDQGFYTSKGRFVDRYEGMKIAHACGQVSDEVAFSKKWHDIKINAVDREPTDWDIVDTEKYNKLFSEDLY
jgi:hypothetical protein